MSATRRAISSSQALAIASGDSVGSVNSTFALESARAFIAGKIRNSRYVLQRGARDANDNEEAQTLRAAAEHLAASLRAAAVAADLDSLRGVEGDAARGFSTPVGCFHPRLKDHYNLHLKLV